MVPNYQDAGAEEGQSLSPLSRIGTNHSGVLNNKDFKDSRATLEARIIVS